MEKTYLFFTLKLDDKKIKKVIKDKLSIVKSDLIGKLWATSNFLRKDLLRLVDITLYEIQNSLKEEKSWIKRYFYNRPDLKSKKSRNPKQMSLNIPEKKIYI